MARITGTVDGTPVQASGFVVMIRRDLRDSYVATWGGLDNASDLQVTFAVDRGHAFPGRVNGFTKNTPPDNILILKVDGEIPQEVTSIDIAGSMPSRQVVQLVACTGNGPPTVVDRSGLRPIETLPFLLTVDGAIGPEYFGGPVLVDGKAAGVIIKNTGGRAVAMSADLIRSIFVSLKLIDPSAVSK